MATLQGDFTDAESAEQAKSALMQAGIAASRVRTWNILDGGGSNQRGGSAIPAGAVLGGAVAGSAGLVAGAGIGALLDEGNDDGTHLPDPSGVRVVVDSAEDEQQIEEILRSAGAANVQNMR